VPVGCVREVGAWADPVGLLAGLAVRQPLTRSVSDIAHFNNPWEACAYRRHGPHLARRYSGALSIV
jgi:hypothetical protein